MKTIQDIYKALGEGHTLVFINGEEVKAGDTKQFNFTHPQDWSIKEEVKMYCRFKKLADAGRVDMSTHYEIGSENYKMYINKGWTPMTPTKWEDIV